MVINFIFKLEFVFLRRLKTHRTGWLKPIRCVDSIVQHDHVDEHDADGGAEHEQCEGQVAGDPGGGVFQGFQAAVDQMGVVPSALLLLAPVDGQDVDILAQAVGQGGVDLVVAGLRGGMEHEFRQHQHQRVGQVAANPSQNAPAPEDSLGPGRRAPVLSEQGADPAENAGKPPKQQRTVE